MNNSAEKPTSLHMVHLEAQISSFACSSETDMKTGHLGVLEVNEDRKHEGMFHALI